MISLLRYSWFTLIHVYSKVYSTLCTLIHVYSNIYIHMYIIFRFLLLYVIIDTEYSSLCYSIGLCWLSLLYMLLFSCSAMSNSLWPHGLQHPRLPCPSSISQSLLKLLSIESVMPSNHLILCHPLLLLPSVLPSVRVFSSESALHIRWPEYLELQLQHQSLQWIFRVDILYNWLVWSPCCPKDS